MPGVPREVRVGAAMTRRVYAVRPEWTLLQAVRVLRRHHVSGVPVIDEHNRVVGILSETDVLRDLDRAAGVASMRGLLDLLLAASGAARRTRLEACVGRLRRAKVADAMRRRVVTVSPKLDVGEAGAILRHRGFNRLPVVENGALVGLVTRQDLLDAQTTASGRPIPARRFDRGPA